MFSLSSHTLFLATLCCAAAGGIVRAPRSPLKASNTIVQILSCRPELKLWGSKFWRRRVGERAQTPRTRRAWTRHRRRLARGKWARRRAQGECGHGRTPVASADTDDASPGGGGGVDEAAANDADAMADEPSEHGRHRGRVASEGYRLVVRAN
ncbi:hypothetical protein FB451DRAFT_1181432 [Mycena latifolia]|nr:hypothetical protein FB451DRAFT_1181432 [Mycena latifolia]